ncbi:MAG TPA: hypothetical protein PL155_03985 [Candidatus Omnitrophota bacterium]|nr:hypothetical protein [Candidatus Omnitrophota bacterium]HPD84365.1 hypothetical protein [Candidatus Omnitrophota bacterium]HRZ03223.1 hypothetical protein [Candidatus Omnitrophota bacterium]
MISLLPFLVSFVIGYLLCRILLKETKSVNAFLYFFISIGTGLGISSFTTFLSFLLCNGFNPAAIWGLHTILFVLLSAILYFSGTKIFPGPAIKSGNSPWIYLFCWGFFAAAAFVIYALAQGHPFGEWDGWAIWNMKSRFLLLSSSRWADVSTKLHWHTQPDYPLLLPFINVWGWSLSHRPLTEIPLLVSVIFTVSCAGLLFGGLMYRINNPKAFLVCVALISLPAYIGLGTSQYADIILAYYLLATLIVLTSTVREKDNGCAYLAGLMLGFMSFSKNEGIVITLLLVGITILYLSFKESPRRAENLKLIKCLVMATALSLLPILIFKLFMTVPNRDIALTKFSESFPFLNWEGLCLTINFLGQELLGAHWHFLWPLAGAAIILGARQCFRGENKILSLFFVAYLLVVILVYLTTVNFDLLWRLSRTAQRILFTLLPSFLFFVFYVSRQREEEQKRQ